MAEFYDVIDATLVNSLKYFADMHPVLKVELLDYLEQTIGEITQDMSRNDSGSIEINFQQGVRRTCSITLINNFSQYNPSANKGIWFHTKFRVYTGFIVGTNTYWFTQGIFILTNPSILNDHSNRTITLNGVDKFGVLGSETSFHELNGSYKIPAGTKIKNAVKDLLAMPIGNSGGKLYTCTITGTQYWAGANTSPTGGYFLTTQFGLIPSAIKTVTVTRSGTTFNNPYYAYNNGTSSFWFSAPQGDYYYIQNGDSITITAYAGYPLDPQMPIIDNRIIDYYDAIEFLGDEYKDPNVVNRYILADSDGRLPNIPYSNNLPFYKVYLNREEVAYDPTATSAKFYSYNSTDNAIYFGGFGTLTASDSISIIAKMRGSIGDIKLPYDVIKSPNEFFSDLLIELATITACDVYYDAFGRLNFVKGNEKQEMDNLPTVWEFSDSSNYYFDSSVEMDFTNMFNVIKVVGTNSSAKDICEKTVKNTQLNSPMCVQALGEKIKYVESSFCYNQPRTEDFANYLLQKYSRIQQTLNFNTILLPFLDVNQVVAITDNNLQLQEARFIIQTLSVPLTTDANMSVVCSNTANIPYFEAQGG